MPANIFNNVLKKIEYYVWHCLYTKTTIGKDLKRAPIYKSESTLTNSFVEVCVLAMERQALLQSNFFHTKMKTFSIYLTVYPDAVIVIIILISLKFHSDFKIQSWNQGILNGAK